MSKKPTAIGFTGDKMDWDRHSILAEINRKGETLASLERRYGVPSNTLSVALGKPFPKAESIISDFLGKPARVLFAYHHNRRKPTFRQLDISRVAGRKESQKCMPAPDMEAVA